MTTKRVTKEVRETAEASRRGEATHRGARVDGPLGKIAELVGGLSRLSEMVGLSRRTLQRYNGGEIAPPKHVVMDLAELAKELKTRAPFTTSGGSR